MNAVKKPSDPDKRIGKRYMYGILLDDDIPNTKNPLAALLMQLQREKRRRDDQAVKEKELLFRSTTFINKLKKFEKNVSAHKNQVQTENERAELSARLHLFNQKE